jgi:hypothetical protein
MIIILYEVSSGEGENESGFTRYRRLCEVKGEICSKNLIGTTTACGVSI